MKHQQVSVDFWAMGKAMVTYGVLTALVWLMLKLLGSCFTLPSRLRAQNQSMEDTLKELQRRFPDLDITKEDLENAEKEFEELTKEAAKEADTSDDVNQSDDKEKMLEIEENKEDKKNS
ncbi:hypothetical protein O0L34_g4117 [Tuta absoluta]|nr:hypothetical protein O0L34_g4117 [Tuta absoluta]